MVDAGLDPVVGRRTYKRETILGHDDAAWKKARNKRTAFLGEVLKQHFGLSPSTGSAQTMTAWKSNVSFTRATQWPRPLGTQLECSVDKLRDVSSRSGTATSRSTARGRSRPLKTHQMLRVALDSETVALLRAHKEWSHTRNGGQARDQHPCSRGIASRGRVRPGQGSPF